MPLPIEEIKKLIKETIPDASIDIKDLLVITITILLQSNRRCLKI